MFYRRRRRDGGGRQSMPSHSGEAPRGQSDAQARRIRSIGFLEASRGFKGASKNLQEASWKLQEASRRHPRSFKRPLGSFKKHPRGFKRLPEASQRLPEASRGFQKLPRGIVLQMHCVLQSLFDGASNPLCFTGDGGATVDDGRVDPPTRERLQRANLTHRREGLEA